MLRLTLTKLLAAVTVFAGFLLLGGAPTASASMSPGEPVADRQVDAWLALAGATWGQTPDCPEGVLIDRAERIPGPGMWAAAEMPGCHISLDPDFYPAPASWTATTQGRRQWETQMCNVVVHEFGHLLGHAHSDDPHDLMAPIVPLTVAGCRPGAAKRVEKVTATGKAKKVKRSRTRGGKSRKAPARRPAA